MNFFLDSFSKDALEAHNKFRAIHEVSPVKWCRSLAKEAETWAIKLAQENGLRNGDTDDGENLYAVSGKTDLKGNEVVEKWYEGIRNYKFHRPGFQSDAGHFTQIVWKNTREIGVGKAKSSDGKLFVVARYRPAGNVMNRFEQNVSPKKSSSPLASREISVKDRYWEPMQPERRIPDGRRNHEDFFKDFKDMKLDIVGGRSITKTETVTYTYGPRSKTVITKTYTSGEDHNYLRKDHNAHKTNWSETKDSTPPRSLDIKPAIAAKSSTKINKSFKDQCTSSHNKYRAMHSAPPLKWNDDIAKQAQWYAEQLARACTLQHSSKSERGDVGENLAMFSGNYDNAGERASDMWYDEVKDYNFSGKGYQGGCGHFTQLVWKGSKELGMGRAKTSDERSTIVVARYQPAGNVVNYMSDNVSPRRI